ncbi:MAG: ABC transporter substrate-binding protein [Nocardioidaceae bacterium]
MTATRRDAQVGIESPPGGGQLSQGSQKEGMKMARCAGSRLRVLQRTGAVAVVLMCLAACGSSDGSSSDGSSDGGTYVWGLDAELSGPISFYGQGLLTGVKAYVDSVNAEGGINGKKIDLKSLDDAGDSSRAAANAVQLVTADKVNAIFGHALSANCTAATATAERYKVPLGCVSVATPNSWVYNIGADDSQAPEALFEAAKSLSGKSNPRAALIYGNTLTVEQMAKDVKSGASAAGVNVVASEELSLTATDSSTQVAKVVAAKPDVVWVSGTPTGFASIVKGLRSAGVNVPVVQIDGTSSIAALSTSKDANTYALSIYKQVDPASTDSFVKGYIAAVKKATGKTTVTFSDLNSSLVASGYMGAYAFGDALKRCGASCSGEDLQEALNSTSVSMGGMLDSFAYGETSRYPYRNWYLYKSQGTKVELKQTIPLTD